MCCTNYKLEYRLLTISFVSQTDTDFNRMCKQYFEISINSVEPKISHTTTLCTSVALKGIYLDQS